ncbi:ImpE family T6SS protein Cts1E [Enterobacter cloacae subsp. cloacae]|uniref:type VI secretion system accessory protein TagJ n=1 Tax=Enterobacter cloacae TaxID=550 RepID=UPI00063AB787|nr:type VI secretion system accessory protein TagJ [Enterobacter cloacae]KLG05274.1 ImpE family T6SS protein Cts1E [Enterobacter cloacae subsp. cloacae]
MQGITSLTETLKTASLKDLLEKVLSQVKTYPQDLKAREVLFKLYCVDGAWDSALLQLQTLMQLEESMQKQCELYKNLIFSEMQRTQVLSGERLAATLQGDMSPWMVKIHQANEQYYQGKNALSDITRSEAFDLAPESSGKGETLNEFTWIADSDERLGPICEFICAGGYRWLPFSSIQQLNVSKPKDLLDLLWLPSSVNVAGEEYFGFIPARYPIRTDDEQTYKLGSKTEWTSLSDLLTVGHGRKVLITDRNEHSIMEVGKIVFE